MALHRKRRKRYEIAGHVRYLTFSCYQRLPLFLNKDIRDAFAEQLGRVRLRQSRMVHSWIIMPEHVHLMITPSLPVWTVSKVLSALKRPFAQGVILRWRKLDAPILKRIIDSRGICRFWQVGGGYDRNIYSENEYAEKVEYVHANPVRRGLVALPSEWSWSSAAWYAGNRSGPVGIDFS